MSLMLPDWAEWVLEMLGFDWPTGDEDKMMESAQQWRTFAAAVEQLQSEGVTAAGNVLSANTGDSIDGFSKTWEKFAGSGSGYLDDARNVSEMIAIALDVGAGIIIGMKVAVIAQLAILAAEIIAAQAAAPFTLGLSEIGAAGATQATRMIVRRILKEAREALVEAVVETLKEPAVSALEAMISDAIAQGMNMNFGAQNGFDVGRSVKTGAEAGVEAAKNSGQTFAESLRDGAGAKAGGHARHGLDSAAGHGDSGGSESSGGGSDSSGGGSNSSGGGSDSSGSSSSGGGSSDSGGSGGGSDSGGSGGGSSDSTGGGTGSGSGSGPTHSGGSGTGGTSSTSTPDSGPSSSPSPSPSPDSAGDSGSSGDSSPSAADSGNGSTPDGSDGDRPTPQSQPLPPPDQRSPFDEGYSGGNDNPASTPDSTPAPDSGPTPDSSRPDSDPVSTQPAHDNTPDSVRPDTDNGPVSTQPAHDNTPDAARPDTDNGPVSTQPAQGPHPDSAPSPAPDAGPTPDQHTPAPSHPDSSPAPDHSSQPDAAPSSHPSSPNEPMAGNPPTTADTPAPDHSGNDNGNGNGNGTDHTSHGDDSNNSGGGRGSVPHANVPSQGAPAHHTPSSGPPVQHRDPASGDPMPHGDDSAADPHVTTQSADTMTAPPPSALTDQNQNNGPANNPAQSQQQAPQNAPQAAGPVMGAPASPPQTGPTPSTGSPSTGTPSNRRPDGSRPVQDAAQQRTHDRPAYTPRADKPRQDQQGPGPRADIPAQRPPQQPQNDRPSGHPEARPDDPRQQPPQQRPTDQNPPPDRRDNNDSTADHPPAPAHDNSAPSPDDHSDPTPTSDPTPASDTRNRERPGGLEGPTDEHQQHVTDAIPKDDDGGPQRHPDPDDGNWVDSINDPGPDAPGRGNNCVDAALATADTYSGNPTAAASRTPDTHDDGTPSDRGESNGRDRIEDTLGARFHDYGDGKDAFHRLENDLRDSGHGSQAVIITQDAHGRAHAWNAVNHNGKITYVDAQTGQRSDKPLHDGSHGVHAIPLDSDRRPVDATDRPSGESNDPNTGNDRRPAAEPAGKHPLDDSSGKDEGKDKGKDEGEQPPQKKPKNRPAADTRAALQQPLDSDRAEGSPGYGAEQGPDHTAEGMLGDEAQQRLRQTHSVQQVNWDSVLGNMDSWADRPPGKDGDAGPSPLQNVFDHIREHGGIQESDLNHILGDSYRDLPQHDRLATVSCLARMSQDYHAQHTEIDGHDINPEGLQHHADHRAGEGKLGDARGRAIEYVAQQNVPEPDDPTDKEAKQYRRDLRDERNRIKGVLDGKLGDNAALPDFSGRNYAVFEVTETDGDGNHVGTHYVVGSSVPAGEGVANPDHSEPAAGEGLRQLDQDRFTRTAMFTEYEPCGNAGDLGGAACAHYISENLDRPAGAPRVPHGEMKKQGLPDPPEQKNPMAVSYGTSYRYGQFAEGETTKEAQDAAKQQWKDDMDRVRGELLRVWLKVHA